MITNAYIFEAVAKREITPEQGADALLALDSYNQSWIERLLWLLLP